MGVTGPSSGQILYNGAEYDPTSRQQHKEFLRDVQPIYRDPFGVYNPFYKADHLFLFEAVKKFNLAAKNESRRLVAQALETVGLRPEEILGRFPHELSGGQRQGARVMIAHALVLKPAGTNYPTNRFRWSMPHCARDDFREPAHAQP